MARCTFSRASPDRPSAEASARTDTTKPRRTDRLDRLPKGFALREGSLEAFNPLASDCSARTVCGLSCVARSYAATAFTGSPPANQASPS